MGVGIEVAGELTFSGGAEETTCPEETPFGIPNILNVIDVVILVLAIIMIVKDWGEGGDGDGM